MLDPWLQLSCSTLGCSCHARPLAAAVMLDPCYLLSCSTLGGSCHAVILSCSTLGCSCHVVILSCSTLGCSCHVVIAESVLWIGRNIFNTFLFGGHVLFRASGTPVLDSWWRLLWVSKPEWVLPYLLFFAAADVLYIPWDSPLILHMPTSWQSASPPVLSQHTVPSRGEVAGIRTRALRISLTVDKNVSIICQM